MKIYLAGERQHANGDKVPLWLQGGYVKRRLFSYFYHRDKGNRPSPDILKSKELGMELFLDSGAFTAFSKGATILPHEYADFIRSSPEGLWHVCSSLDHIGHGHEAAEKSHEYFRELESYGVNVCPVFHVREPDDWLRYYVDCGYDYIFIGGMVPESSPWLKDRLDNLWGNIICGEDHKPKVRVHGFGMTDQDLMFRYPWYSVDSSSWLMIGIFGKCVFITDNRGSTVRVQFSDKHSDARKINSFFYDTLGDEMRQLVDKWLSRFNIDVSDIKGHYSYRDAINAYTFQELERFGVETFAPDQETLFGGFEG